MEHINKSRLVPFLFFVVMFITFLWGEETIILGTGEWSPFSTETLEGNGFCCEIITAAFKEMKIDAKFKFMPWKRNEAELEDGKVFGIFPYTTTKDRKEKFDFTDKIATMTGRLFYYIPSNKIPKGFNWRTYADLRSYKIGGGFGYWYEKPFAEAGLTVEYAATDEQNIKKLAAGRVDLVAVEEKVGWSLITKLFPDIKGNFSTLDKPTDNSDVFIMVSKKYPNYKLMKKKFNIGLAIIINNGTYEKIRHKYRNK